MTDKNIDQLIEKTMKQAVLPESVQNLDQPNARKYVDKVLKDSDGEKAILFHSRKKAIGGRHRWKAACVAAAVVACSSITVFPR